MASWETIKSQIGKVTNKVVAKTGEVADTASKHVKLKTIEGNLSEKYELLGRLAYKHIKGVEVSEEKVNALTSEIAALISEKKHIKAEIEADKAKKAAEKQAKINVTLAKIVEAEALTVTDKDMDAEYESLAKQYELELDKIKSMIPADEIKTSLETRKAVKLIVDSAVAVAPKTE